MKRIIMALSAMVGVVFTLVPAPVQAADPTPTCTGVDDISQTACTYTVTQQLFQGGLFYRTVNGGPRHNFLPEFYLRNQVHQCRTAFDVIYLENEDLRIQIRNLQLQNESDRANAQREVNHLRRRIDRQAATISHLRYLLNHKREGK